MFSLVRSAEWGSAFTFLFLFLKVYLIYLIGRGTKREGGREEGRRRRRETERKRRENFPFAGPSLNCCNTQGSGQAKARNVEFHPYIHVDGRGSSMCATVCCFPSHISREPDRKWNSQDSKASLLWDASVAGGDRYWLNPRCYRTGPKLFMNVSYNSSYQDKKQFAPIIGYAYPMEDGREIKGSYSISG